MRNTFLIVLILMLFTACTKTETSASSEISADSALVAAVPDSVAAPVPKVSKNQAFLDKFKEITLDSTAFSPPSYEAKTVGPELTKEELALFPETLDISGFLGSEYNGFQAHSKFQIDERLTGIVARMPGEYSFTALKLFFYDRVQDEFLPQFFEVADMTGDAGYSEEIKSWLWKENGQLKSFLYRWTKIEKVEPDDPVRESRTDDYYLINLNPTKFDTLRVSKNNLPKYRKLLDKKQ